MVVTMAKFYWSDETRGRELVMDPHERATPRTLALFDEWR
jgi:hypothetical protein